MRNWENHGENTYKTLVKPSIINGVNRNGHKYETQRDKGRGVEKDKGCGLGGAGTGAGETSSYSILYSV